MFCFQCEQTAKGTGCTVQGVCGKDAQTAALQDLLVYQTKQIGAWAHRARQLDATEPVIDQFILKALFSTVTNVNFDPARLQTLLDESAAIKDQAKALYEKACLKKGKTPEAVTGASTEPLAKDPVGLIRQGEAIGIPKRKAALGDDIAGLQELLTSGLKGTAAYADHALILGKEDDAVYAFFHEALSALLTDHQPTANIASGRSEQRTPPTTADDLLKLCLKCGEVNLKAMELLDAANTGAYGHPVPTPVRIHPLKGKAIVVSGHDLKDLEEILKQTEGKGINVYTHGEMLPAHGYPALKKHKHLVGNYGGAWQNQRTEFEEFPGAILMTTNCIQKPNASYQNRIFTCGLVAWPGVGHIANRDFTLVIQAALAAEGFKMDGPKKTILVGFGHQTVLNVADKVVQAVKSGTLRRFFLIGGCDGAKSGRNYYTDFAQQVPDDCIILTLACGKYRFNKLDFGTLGGIPRLLDCGQCNDAYSAIRIALALANVFKCGVNNLPLSFILSWFEQKAVCILLTLLHLGIRNMRLGPSLPACLTPGVLKILIDKFNIIPITTATEDLKAILDPDPVKENNR
ncbi:MAG: hydroxylamine reductase [Verrucomicrobia bacterium]|nr:hydroxylamine reductase [Verrucomicrobiota bacterium]MBU4292183.1 hydroxylamine reductase [Verrucomicrobiota bacterium]MBU4428757.1 hydroxylamine reductase [Verrucomicrobiota bacterium]MCG2681627.1 hydroxylamine reductase [Kiritimatiellia bacterium]